MYFGENRPNKSLEMFLDYVKAEKHIQLNEILNPERYTVDNEELLKQLCGLK